MQQLTPEGQRVVDDLARRHGFSAEAVTHMLFAVLHGNGAMAQFNHGEFAGSGQWMRGGMIMTSDMFNHALKGRIDALCSELSGILANQQGLLRSGSFQSQSQSGGGQQQQAGAMGASSLFVPDPADNWWPAELGSPNATGAQNHVRYAYFADKRRLAVKVGNDVTVHDTLDHQIGGFSQQQGAGSTVTFTSQYGTVTLASLPMVSRNGRPVTPAPAAPAAAPAGAAPPGAAPPGAAPPGAAPVTASPEHVSTVPINDILSAIERLGDLKAKGILTDEEFSRKKAELLARL
jgi:hypothetical protein